MVCKVKKLFALFLQNGRKFYFFLEIERFLLLKILRFMEIDLGLVIFLKNKKRNSWLNFSLNFLCESEALESSFFDTGFFACKCTQVVQFCAANFTSFVYGDAFHERWIHRENTLNTNVSWHFANRETFFVQMAYDFDNIAPVFLNTFFVTFFDSVAYCYGISGFERGEVFYFVKSLFCNFY